MATRSMNTMAEGLGSLRQLVSDMKSMADADVPWLIQLETTILQKEREPIDGGQQQGPPPGPEMGPPGMGPGGPPPGMDPSGGMPGGMPPTPQPGGSGLPDEIRRVLSQ